MDDRPFRVPQPERRPAQRGESSSRSSELSTPRAEQEEVAALQHPVASHRAPKKEAPKKGRFIFPVIGGVLVVIALIIGAWLWLGTQPKTAIDSGKYQVVFLTNGQFYFGKLAQLNNDYLKLTDVYYMQTESTDSSQSNGNAKAQQPSANQDYKLIKLGNEIHGPEDAMMIANSQILYYENLKPDSKVAQLIKQDSGSN